MNLSKRCKGLNVLFCCGIAALAGSMPAMGSTNFVSASMSTSTSCGNQTDLNEPTTASVNASTLNNPPSILPFTCPDGNRLFGGAFATSSGTLQVTAEIDAPVGNNTITDGLSAMSTAELFDTLTFTCGGGPCSGTFNASLIGVLTAAEFSMLALGGAEYVSYNVTITDTTTSATYLGSGALCSSTPPTAPPASLNCTATETNPSSGFSVTTPFTITNNDSYTFEIVMTSFVEATNSNDIMILATGSDPMSFDLPGGMSYTAASDEQFAQVLPEPSSWLLVGGGLVLCLGLFRRRLAV